MTKLIVAFATIALAATPVLACPGHGDDAAPRTVEKTKPAPKTQQAKAKQAPAKQPAKDQAKTKPADPKPKTDKVSKR